MAVSSKHFSKVIGPAISRAFRASGRWMPQNWPPEESFKMDSDASQWQAAGNTQSDDLHRAASFFIRSGWPVEALDEFIAGIVPSGDWFTDDPIQGRRERNTYDDCVQALFDGYWEKGIFVDGEE